MKPVVFDCDCGGEVYVDFEWNGLDYRKKFFTCDGEEILRCPECGENLSCLFYERKRKQREVECV